MLAVLGAVALVAACGRAPHVPVPRGAAYVGHLCAGLTYAGFPMSQLPMPERSHFACHDGYALEFNPTTHTAVWVVERLTGEGVSQNTARAFADFRPDPQIPKGSRSEPRHFFKTGYDRGHLAPPEDFRNSPVRMSQSFYYSNLVPQDAQGNRGAWALLERHVRAWAKSEDELFVITGPLFSGGQPLAWVGTVENNNQFGKPTAKAVARAKIAVPTHLYKVIFSPRRNQAVAFVLPNGPLAATPATLAAHEVAVGVLEQAAALTFFPDLPPVEADRIKRQFDPAQWPLWAEPEDPAVR